MRTYESIITISSSLVVSRLGHFGFVFAQRDLNVQVANVPDLTTQYPFIKGIVEGQKGQHRAGMRGYS